MFHRLWRPTRVASLRKRLRKSKKRKRKRRRRRSLASSSSERELLCLEEVLKSEKKIRSSDSIETCLKIVKIL